MKKKKRLLDTGNKEILKVYRKQKEKRFIKINVEK